MANKLTSMFIIWACVIVAYIILAATMPAINQIVVSANASLVASANMSQFPGAQEAVETYPIYAWAIPGLVGIVLTTIMLVKK